MGFLIWQLVVQEKKVPINSANIKPHNPSHSSRCAVPVPKKIPPNSQRKEIRVANESMRHTLGEQAVVLHAQMRSHFEGLEGMPPTNKGC